MVTGTATEPLLSRAGLQTAATVIIGIVVAWGLPLSNTQQAAILFAVGALSPFILAWWARRHVNSPATMKAVMNHRNP
jgi:uncharacterized YccA/Bax inhibitor family protein